jgi:hypothetical protein
MAAEVSSKAGSREFSATRKAQHWTKGVRGDHPDEVEPRHGRFEISGENWGALNRFYLRQQIFSEKR